MKNIILGIAIVAVLGIGVVYSINYNKEEPVPEAVVEERDEFGNKYNLDNEHFLISTPSEVVGLIESDETMEVFVGRET